MNRKKIKLFDTVVDRYERESVLSVLKSHFWASGAGTGNVSKFENKFKKYVNASECVAVNSGTAALHLALSLFNLRDKEVLLPSMSFVSTAHAIVYNGSIPKFVDVDKKNLCIDIKDIETKITKKTGAILAVHFGGMPCNMNKLKEICKKHNLKLIEDAAHASGSNYNGKKIGSHGDAVCFSFHPVKNLAMPNGGAITLNSKKILKNKKNLESLRWCGITDRQGTDYDVKKLGWNYYMNEFSAVIGLQQLKKLDKLNVIRKKIAQKYFDEINVETKMPFDNNCSYHLYWILVKNRKKFQEKLYKNGIETGTHYKPIHQMTMYKNNISLPITESVSKQIVTIPIHPNLKKYQIDFIVESINKFI